MACAVLYIAYQHYQYMPHCTYDNVQVCFTPGRKCTPFILQTIYKAKKNIKIQAYSFTSSDIANVLVVMKNRGVDVQVILDKSNLNQNEAIKKLKQHNIPVLIDYVPGIAHNKIIIIDDEYVLTGSFNFSQAADSRNVENVAVIKSNEVAKLYLNNWLQRERFSKHIDDDELTTNIYKPWKNEYRRKPVKKSIAV